MDLAKSPKSQGFSWISHSKHFLAQSANVSQWPAFFVGSANVLSEICLLARSNPFFGWSGRMNFNFPERFFTYFLGCEFAKHAKHRKTPCTFLRPVHVFMVVCTCVTWCVLWHLALKALQASRSSLWRKGSPSVLIAERLAFCNGCAPAFSSSGW